MLPSEQHDRGALSLLQVILRVEQRRAFMSPMKLAIMPHLLKLYDFTTVIEPATLGFSMAKPTLKPRWQSLYYPLTDGVWASILAVLALVPVALILVRLRSTSRCLQGGSCLRFLCGFYVVLFS